MSNIDFKSKKVDKNQARKKIADIVRNQPGNVYFSGHASSEMEKDGLTSVDVWNVMKSIDARVVDEGEFVRGSYRYRLETNFIMVVIAFHSDGEGFTVVTVWDKRKEITT